MNRNRLMLGDDASSFTDQSVPSSTYGPLPTISVDSNLLLIGAGVLVLSFLLRGASRSASRYSSHRRSRSRRKKALLAELRSL